MIARSSRTWTRTWIAAALCLVVLLGAVAWISITLLRLDRSEAEMRREAVVEENVRLALWRMDSAVAPIVARESVRPAGEYRSRFAAPEHVRLHFQLDFSDTLTSPQGGGAKLDPLRKLVVRERLAPELTSRDVVTATAAAQQAPSMPKQQAQAPPQKQQQQKSSIEWSKRALSVENVYRQNPYSNANAGYQGFTDGLDQVGPDGQVGQQVGGQVLAMTPTWIDGELLLARRIAHRGGETIQGCWLNWPEMRSWLVAEIRDLLPEADLEPADEKTTESGEETTRSLASLPVQLVAGAVPLPEDTGSPVALVLVIIWCAVLLAAGAVVALVGGISALSERRAAFVAAVTHELRTPLTTLQTYSEMLVDGKITDPKKRGRYLATLQREALRLGHLVENVLSYSRIERGRGGVRKDQVSARAVLERASGRLSERAADADMALEIACGGEAPLEFVGDGSAVEHILFNLVDNACKYAAGADDRRIIVSASPAKGAIEFRVRDHGPGVPEDVRKKLFKPFSKSVQRAATSAPGVGLGLALSRRLAREMGGELILAGDGRQGTCFVLSVRPAS